jgi:hypothetical protein
LVIPSLRAAPAAASASPGKASACPASLAPTGELGAAAVWRSAFLAFFSLLSSAAPWSVARLARR